MAGEKLSKTRIAHTNLIIDKRTSTMKKLIKKLIQKQGYNVAKSTPPDRVRSLIEKLNPTPIEMDFIRLGPNGDGGYLIPDDIEGVKTCFSPGVGKLSVFEEHCINRGMKVFMADRSVEKPILNAPESEYQFVKKHIGCVDNDDFMTMDEWVKANSAKDDNDLLLQMDIEGTEYPALINMTDPLMKRFRIIVVEFHTLDDLWNPHFFNIAEIAIDRLLQTHTCVHIHPNNSLGIEYQFGVAIPKVAEFTFLRNDRLKIKNTPLKFPHKLDYDNTKKQHIDLPENWYKAKKTSPRTNQVREGVEAA